MTSLSVEQLKTGVTVTCGTPQETETLGETLAQVLLTAGAELPRFIALYGDLGVGKTAFTRGFARAAAPGCAVRSPTFTLVNEYRAAGRRPVFHFDMYRIDSEDDLESIGFDDYLSPRTNAFILAEWCEKIPFALPRTHIRVTIVKNADNPDCRTVTLQTEGGNV